MHCTYQTVILQHHQTQSSKEAGEENVEVLLRFCIAPQNDEIALQHFFFLSYSNASFCLFSTAKGYEEDRYSTFSNSLNVVIQRQSRLRMYEHIFIPMNQYYLTASYPSNFLDNSRKIDGPLLAG